jgi:hypothetical protein
VKAFELSYWRLDDWTASYDGFITKDLWNLMSDEVLSHVSLELMGKNKMILTPLRALIPPFSFG